MNRRLLRLPKVLNQDLRLEEQFHNWNRIQHVKKSVGVQNLHAGNLQLGSFVVVRLVEYKPIAHFQLKNTYQPNFLPLIFQTAEIFFQLLKALYTISFDSSEVQVTSLMYLQERILDIVKAHRIYI